MIVSSIQRQGEARLIRGFNPQTKPIKVNLGNDTKAAKAITLDGRADDKTLSKNQNSEFAVAPRRIATFLISSSKAKQV